ncbi:MAG TPA: HAD hydrolase-like protein [Actinocrinis sp.]|nr:HAD hydrolase-like protein [Actinocrinis sp.]
MNSVRHIVWDWNGTLFDDQELVVLATNASVRALGVDRMVTNEEYQRGYRRPMQDFYADMVGFVPTEEQWLMVNKAFATAYDDGRHTAGLNAEALAAMDSWAPRSQSLLSMYGHAELVELTGIGGFGLHTRLVRIDGRPPEHDFGPKYKYLARHFAQLQTEDPDLLPGEIALIGDCVDDAHAALQLGAAAVLYSGGSSSRENLSQAGVPVAESLLEAVRLVGGLAGTSPAA